MAARTILKHFFSPCFLTLNMKKLDVIWIILFHKVKSRLRMFNTVTLKDRVILDVVTRISKHEKYIYLLRHFMPKR